jgi:hypothetical protein
MTGTPFGGKMVIIKGEDTQQKKRTAKSITPKNLYSNLPKHKKKNTPSIIKRP